ncbi:DUF4288 domain-containing protein [Paenibacillus sp. PR3]|uniref:DUF4288 domain-containing protein n=1 Tax=Paenibacillus terricola TaxID=2763503 RepID=A0ABR8MVA6_9BACL|nr:DUF4288 domain-containing protein [Paenibacillus terricola]MBD3919510.1 DUF4288 domain-containing protein [Paenibacillus terricola]
MWFTVQMLFKSFKELEENEDTDTYEESIILIKAETKDVAVLIAEKKGKEAEIAYKNLCSEEVKWKFIKVVDVYEIIDETIESGTEVFSRFILVPQKTELKDVLNRYYQEE